MRWLLVFALAALWSCAGLRVFPQRETRPRTIGLAVPLSGDYELLGKAVVESARLALEGAARFELVVEDTRGTAEGASAAVDRLAAQGVVGIVGALAGEELEGAAPAARRLGLPLITLSKAQADGLGDYVFRYMVTLESQAEELAERAVCEGKQRFAVLAPTTEYGKALTDAFVERVRSMGAQVDLVKAYPREQTTFKVEARAVAGREVATRAKADAVFLADDWRTVSLIAPALAVEDLVTNACDVNDVQRQRKTVGGRPLRQVALLGWSGWSSPPNARGEPELLSRGGKYIHCGVYVDGFFAASDRRPTRAFVERFQRRHGRGRVPTLLHASAYDATGLLRHLLEREPSDQVVSSQALEARLREVRGYEGATGKLVGFDERGEPKRELFFVQTGPRGLREVRGAAAEGCRQVARR